MSFKYTAEDKQDDDVRQFAVDDDKISMAFSKGRENDRKSWIMGLDEEAFVDHNQSEITIPDFIDKELVREFFSSRVREGWMFPFFFSRSSYDQVIFISIQISNIL